MFGIVPLVQSIPHAQSLAHYGALIYQESHLLIEIYSNSSGTFTSLVHRLKKDIDERGLSVTLDKIGTDFRRRLQAALMNLETLKRQAVTAREVRCPCVKINKKHCVCNLNSNINFARVFYGACLAFMLEMVSA